MKLFWKKTSVTRRWYSVCLEVMDWLPEVTCCTAVNEWRAVSVTRRCKNGEFLKPLIFRFSINQPMFLSSYIHHFYVKWKCTELKYLQSCKGNIQFMSVSSNYIIIVSEHERMWKESEPHDFYTSQKNTQTIQKYKNINLLKTIWKLRNRFV
jgi:hypothetical protein